MLSKRLLSSKAGFTLVELMVVVAIIGLLSAVAIPNFKKYQAKAKTSEAKLQLSAIFTSETSFNMDYDAYAGCLFDMGYNPSGESNQRYYVTGFSTIDSGYDTYSTNGAFACATTRAAGATNGAVFFSANKKVGATAVLATGNLATSKAAATAFTAAASGIIDGSAKTDSWTINESKQLMNTATGF